MNKKTTIKISKELSDDLLIVSKLNGLKKEEFCERLIRESLEPYLEEIIRKRFS